ncbi:hypothetical protein ACGC1H_001115 [Rhizoctonia solani]
MHDSDLPMPYARLIRQWEEAGAALANTVSTYLELCLSLGKLSLSPQAMPREDLASRIDSILEPGAQHTALVTQLAQCQSVLSRTRNRLVSPVYSLPELVLSKIFSHVVYDCDPVDYDGVEWQVQTFYRRLYTLLGVCTIWRDFGISMVTFWSIVPVIRESKLLVSRQTVSLGLSRSHTAPLDLVIVVPGFTPQDILRSVAHHTSRIRSIHIASDTVLTVQNIIRRLTEFDELGVLSELSLCVTDLLCIGRTGNSVYTRFLTENHGLLKLTQSLTRVSLYGASFIWREVRFSIKLVELRLQQVVFGSSSHVHEFVQAISSALELRYLTLISLTSFLDPGPETGARPTVSLPKLQSLVLEDLYHNPLSIMLNSIEPGSHKLTIYLTDKCLLNAMSTGVDHVAPVNDNVLYSLLQKTPVDTLILGGHYSGELIEPDRIFHIFNASKTVKTLEIEGCIIDTDFCFSLKVPPGAHTPSLTGHHFPVIPQWRITKARVVNPESFKELVLSHRVHTMVLEGARDHSSNNPEEWRPLKSQDEIIEWLSQNIPHFRFEPPRSLPSRFESRAWQRLRLDNGDLAL